MTSDAGLKDAEEEFEEAVASWSSFENKLLSRYGADISPIKDSFIQENTDYYRHTAQWRIIEPKEVFGKPQTVYHIDISNVTQERVLGFNDSFFEVALPLMELYQKRDGTVSILKEDDVVQVTAVRHLAIIIYRHKFLDYILRRYQISRLRFGFQWTLLPEK